MSRLSVNLRGLSAYLIPRIIYQNHLKLIFDSLKNKSDAQLESLKFRLNYYNKITADFSSEFAKFKDKQGIHKFPFRKSAYVFDSYALSKYYKNALWITEFGDVRNNFKIPTICKSRSLDKENVNNILLKLDKDRHFCFFKDSFEFAQKLDKAVFRGAFYQPWRKEFFKANENNALCDISHTGKGFKEWKKGRLSKKEQCKFKFIISIEGNDVASNLKWALHSNSLVLAPKMTCETWFMEGLLKPNFHFALIDNENVSEVIEHFLTHQNEALEIINNAHNFIRPFFDKQSELELGLLVLAKYFYYSNQLDLPKHISKLF